MTRYRCVACKAGHNSIEEHRCQPGYPDLAAHRLAAALDAWRAVPEMIRDMVADLLLEESQEGGLEVFVAAYAAAAALLREAGK